MIRDEGALRKQIVELVAFSTPWARKVAWHGPQEGLAERLGVTQGVIDDAVAMIRAGFAPVSREGPIHFKFHLQVADPLYEALEGAAKLARMKPGPFFRAVLHAAMLTSREPQFRGDVRWYGAPSEAVREKGATPSRTHICLSVTVGLHEAISRRAAALGVTKSNYALMWLVDLCSYKLRDLRVDPIQTGQMFDDARAYVLPQIEQAWEHEPGSGSPYVTSSVDTNVMPKIAKKKARRSSSR